MSECRHITSVFKGLSMKEKIKSQTCTPTIVYQGKVDHTYDCRFFYKAQIHTDNRTLKHSENTPGNTYFRAVLDAIFYI